MHSLIGYYNDKTYSAFNWGNTRFVLLDCGEDKPDDTPVYAGLNDFTQLRNDQVNFLQTERRRSCLMPTCPASFIWLRTAVGWI